MARPLRIEFPGAICHITSRGNERRDIVRDDEDRHRFVRFLARVVADHDWVLHAWVLMSNHYHLLVETPHEGLSRGIHWLNQRCAQTLNERHERVGHLFQGRFKGILVEREGHLLELLRYIVLNPVRAGLVASAGDYAWSSYRATAGFASVPPWLEVDWTLAQFHANDRAAALLGYRDFVASGIGAGYKPWDAVRGQIFLGGDGYRERMQHLIDAKFPSDGVPAVQLRAAVAGVDRIAADVASVFRVPLDVFRRRTVTPARKALALIATDREHTLRSIGGWMGISTAAVSKLRDGGSSLYRADESFRRKIDQIRNPGS